MLMESLHDDVITGGHVLLNNFGAAGPSLALVTWFVKFDEITIFTDSVGL